MWIGSDATKERVAAVDWTNRTVIEHRVDPFWARLQELVGRDAEEDLIVSLTEFLAITIKAAVSGEAWRGRVVLYAGDNSNVVSWLSGTTPKNVYARHIFRVFLYIQSYYKFALIPAYIATSTTWSTSP